MTNNNFNGNPNKPNVPLKQENNLLTRKRKKQDDYDFDDDYLNFNTLEQIREQEAQLEPITEFSQPQAASSNPLLLQIEDDNTSLVGILEEKNEKNEPKNDKNEPKIENIVSSADLRCELNLRDIATRAMNLQYNPSRFAPIKMKIKEPKATALIFSSRKVVCLGTKSEGDSKTAARQFAKIIKKLGFDVKFTHFEIHNTVYSIQLNFLPDLRAIESYYSIYCIHDPYFVSGLTFSI